MATRTQYRSQASADIRHLLAELNETGVVPNGYPTQLAKRGYPKQLEEKLGKLSIHAARNTVRGASAKPEIVELIVKDMEKLIGIKATKPKKLDLNDLTLEQIVEEKLLPNRYRKLAAEMTGLSGNTIQQIKDGRGSSASAEMALFKLAAYNQEFELKWRLEKILEAVNKKSLAIS